MNRAMRLDCASHGEIEDWLAICVHVRDGKRPFHFEMPSRERPGQSICAECHRTPITRPDPVLVCADCYRHTIVSKFAAI